MELLGQFTLEQIVRFGASLTSVIPIPVPNVVPIQNLPLEISKWASDLY